MDRLIYSSKQQQYYHKDIVDFTQDVVRESIPLNPQKEKPGFEISNFWLWPH